MRREPLLPTTGPDNKAAMEPCSDGLNSEFTRPLTPPPVTSTPSRRLSSNLDPSLDTQWGQSPDDSPVNPRSVNLNAEQLCLFCASSRAGEILRNCNTVEQLADEIFQVYRVKVDEIQDYFPKYVHDRCRVKIQRQAKAAKKSIRSLGLAKYEETMEVQTLPDFPSLRRKRCSFCHQYPDPPHNSLTCPDRLAIDRQGVGRRKKPLMDLSDRKQGKERIQSLIDKFEEFCELEREAQKDVVAFQYRRLLNKEGKVKAAKTFESFHKNPSQILVKPLSPRKTASRSVMNGVSWNKSRDEYTYFKPERSACLCSTWRNRSIQMEPEPHECQLCYEKSRWSLHPGIRGSSQAEEAQQHRVE